MINNRILLETLSGKSSSQPPIWFMRQAGRYLPEYQAIRKKVSNFMEMCYSPEIAAEVTLQPIRRFGFDASIIFSDILVIPDAMGIKVDFIPSKGPNLSPIRTKEALDNLVFIPEKLDPVYEAVSIVRKELPDSCTLIGFSGSPWTLATYIVEGKSSKDFALVRDIAYRDEVFFSKLIEQLIEAILYHLGKQVENGAEVVQIFDSWASVLSPAQYRKWVIDPTVKIVNAFKCRYPNVPIIAFPKGSGVLYKEFSQAVGVEALSVDYTVPMEWARDNLGKILQGNLDPVCLQSNINEALTQTRDILDIMRNKPFIFNLGHGILPGTSIDNVNKVLEVIRNA